MYVSNLIWNFFQELIANLDNKPTKFTVLLYAYLQMQYNVGTLFEINGIESKDRVSSLKNRNEIIKNIAKIPRTIQKDILKTYLYTAHNAFIQALYPNAKLLSPQDYGLIRFVEIEKTTMSALKEYFVSHITDKKTDLERSLFSTKNTTGMAADYTGQHFKGDPNIEQSSKWNQWQQLVVPTGVLKGSNGLPVIDQTNPLSYTIQNFLGYDLYKSKGFAVDPLENIINLDSKVSTTWENGLKKEMDLLLDVYADLTDEKKMIAEFFAGSSKNSLPPPGLIICIAMQLSQKYKQTILNDLKMYFCLAAGLFDACVSAWYYKSNFNQARPINLIRRYYADKKINSWSPMYKEKSSEIFGKQWLPYQPNSFVTPPFSDYPSGHTTFTGVATKILAWWFSSSLLYDGCSLATIPNQQLLCPLSNISDKMVCIGEFILDKGCSEIEPGITPKEKIILRYKSLEEFAQAVGISRVYGGIHSDETNRVSAELANWVFDQTRNKLINDFGFSSPYKL